MARPIKEIRVSFRIPEKIYQEYKRICKAKGTNFSVALRTHIIEEVKQEEETTTGQGDKS